MKRRIIALLFTALLCAVTIYAKDLKTVIFSVPQMVCENCEAKVMKNIRFEKGVKEIKTDVEKQTVAITYDGKKTNPEKLTEGFAKFKYEVTVASESQNKKEK